MATGNGKRRIKEPALHRSQLVALVCGATEHGSIQRPVIVHWILAAAKCLPYKNRHFY